MSKKNQNWQVVLEGDTYWGYLDFQESQANFLA